MLSGRRVACKDEPERQGVVIRASYGESFIQWDEGKPGWECDEDLHIIPNKSGDAFIAMRNGMGRREDETFPADAVKVHRDRHNLDTEAEIMMSESFGLLKGRVKLATPMDTDRQLTLDIRKRIQHGAPVKGATNGRVDKRKLALAAAVASGQAQLVRRGKLFLSVPKGWVVKKDWLNQEYYYEKVKKVNRRLTLNQRRKLRSAKRRSK